MDQFSIGVLAQLTGLSPATIRAWERRYGLLTPERSEGGHRLYTAMDVATLNQLGALRREGYPLREAIHTLRKGDRPAAAELSILGEASRLGDGDLWAGYRKYALDAVRRFSFEDLDACYTTVLALHPTGEVADGLLMPVLRALGTKWDTHPGGVAEEHFFAAYVRNRLGGRFLQERRRAAGPLLVLACLPGELHELGVLHFAIAVTARGMRPLYLGPHLPLAEALPIVANTAAAGIVLSGTVVPFDTGLAEGLGALTAACEVPVFAGGALADQAGEALASRGVIALGSNYDRALAVIEREIG